MDRVLIVTPHTLSSGEAITAVHVANELTQHGSCVRFLASRHTATLVPAHFEVTVFGGTLEENQIIWTQAQQDFRPTLVLFADYALLSDKAGSIPLANGPWIDALNCLEASLLTFDHLDLARERPAKWANQLPAIRPPDRMGILLPCPVHTPTRPAGRRGMPFRYWKPPRLDAARRAEVRARYGAGPNELLVVHAVPRWAQAMAEVMRHPLYTVLASLLSSYLTGLSRSVLLVSVNDGMLLSSSAAYGFTIVNVTAMSVEEYEELLVCADLMLSENCFSVSLGKAVCAGVPVVLWQHTLNPIAVLTAEDKAVGVIAAEMIAANPKSLEPWLAFPSWNQDLVNALTALTQDADGVLASVERLEIFGGVPTRQAIHALLSDDGERERWRARQFLYAQRVSTLPTAPEAIRHLVACAPDRGVIARDV